MYRRRSTRRREPDLSYVVSTVQRIAERLRPGQLIALESTTYPSTTRDVVLPLLEESGLSVGEDFFLLTARSGKTQAMRSSRRSRSQKLSAVTTNPAGERRSLSMAG